MHHVAAKTLKTKEPHVSYVCSCNLACLLLKLRERRVHDRLTRMHDENLDDQEVELLDENIQPDPTDLVLAHCTSGPICF